MSTIHYRLTVESTNPDLDRAANIVEEILQGRADRGAFVFPEGADFQNLRSEWLDSAISLVIAIEALDNYMEAQNG